MRTATNAQGYNVERLDGPLGWVAIAGPFGSYVLAARHLADMHKTPAAEYRVYESLVERQPA